jgi:nicotinamidase-related amidase
MTRKTARVGWVVDVQNDFAKRDEPGGRLYVRHLSDERDPGAEAVQPELVRAVELLHRHCEGMVFTGDWHGLEDEEIEVHSPDPGRGTYPPHCMGRSPSAAERLGAEIITEIRPDDPLHLDRDASPEEARAVAASAVTVGRPVFIQKDRFSVFEGNRATDEFLAGLSDALDGADLVFHVLGHARDVCVTAFIDGVHAPERREHGHRVIALSDCMAGLGLEPEAETLARWSGAGAEVISLTELERRVGGQ